MTIFDLLKSPQYPQKSILEKLVIHSTWLSKTTLFLHLDKEITQTQYERIDTAYNRYIIHKEPLEYILGYVTFAQLNFFVSPSTIIPRPETEYMIEAVREYFAVQKDVSILLDIGTWSGILWIATMYYEHTHISEAYLCDLSTDALVVAQKNKETLLHPAQQAKTMLLNCSLLDHPLYKEIFHKQHPIMLVANLPYIPDEMFATNADERITKREPTMAFVGWDDGLDLYRKMFDQIIAYSTPTTMITMFLEMMTRQVDLLAKEYTEYFSFAEVKTFHANIRILKVMHT